MPDRLLFALSKIHYRLTAHFKRELNGQHLISCYTVLVLAKVWSGVCCYVASKSSAPAGTPSWLVSGLVKQVSLAAIIFVALVFFAFSLAP